MIIDNYFDDIIDLSAKTTYQFYLRSLEDLLLTIPTHVDNKDSIRILHVDDELSILDSTKQILTLNGSFHVTSVASVNDALKLIDAEDFDVVISDYQMPEKDGLDLLSSLRKCGNKVPFILFTGKGREDVAIKALNLGANYYVNKIGKPETIFGELSHVIKQVVKQSRSELKLALERQRLQTVTKHMSAGLAVISKEFRVLWVNDILKQIFGDDYKGKTCYNLINGLDSPCHKCGVHKIFEGCSGEVVHEQVVKDADGQDVWLEITVTPIKDVKGNTTAALELVNNVTERKKAQAQLKESEEQFRQLFSHMPSGVAVYEAVNSGEDFVFKDFNKAAAKIDKISQDEVIGKRVTEVFPSVKKFGLLNVFQRVYQTGAPESFPVKLYQDNRNSGWRENWVYKLPNDEIVAVYTDVTKQKQAEAELSNSAKQLELVNEKLGVVGRLTRHDTQNKLAVIANSLYLAKMELGENSKALEYFKTIESSLNQITKIFEFSRVYEQLGVEELSKVDVGKSFDSAVSLHNNLDGIQLINYCNCVNVLADSLLDTLFYNLIDNSLKHGKNVTRICLSCEIDEDWLTLTYEDNGIGIPESQKEKIFQEGYGKGTGMGLHMIKIMCKIYGFNIRETGELGKGARFEIDVPKSKRFLPIFVESQSKSAAV